MCVCVCAPISSVVCARSAVKCALDEERAAHARTQRGIVDQQKIIGQHTEKHAKLSAMIEEQKEAIARLTARLGELEAAGSQAMSALSFQKELARLTQERDANKTLLAQKTSEYQKLSAMLLDYEDKLQRQESSAPGNGVASAAAAAESAALKEELKRVTADVVSATAKYEATLVENRKLEKRLASQESKNVFLKKKLDKYDSAQ